MRYSNSEHFYRSGWSGINIEPDPTAFKKLASRRLRDTNLNIGISSQEGTMNFYKFSPSTHSTFSDADAETFSKAGFQIISKEPVRVATLANVLKEYCKADKIDFLSVDTEGFDLEVLKGMDWNLYKPTVICAEDPACKDVLEPLGYSVIGQTRFNIIYKVTTKL